MNHVKIISVYLFLLIISLEFYGCGGDSDEDSAYSLSVEPANLTLDKAAGSSNEFTIIAKLGGKDADWTIKNNTDFAEMSISSGTGTAKVKVYAREKNDGNDHTGELIVSTGDKTQVVTITQKGIDRDMMVGIGDVLEMSYGVACSSRPGNKVKYYYIALYETTEFEKLGSNENKIDDIQKKSSKLFYPNYPEDIIDGKFGLDYQNVIAWYQDIQPDHKYTIVVVPFDSNSIPGEISSQPVSTKSIRNQPEVTPSEYTSVVKNGIEYHKWTATMSAFCSYYYTYACVGEEEFDTYIRNDHGIVLAWNIMMQIPSITDAGIQPVFNKNSSKPCREFIYPKMTSSAQCAELPKYASNDTYLQVATWGFNSSGAYSGIINIMNTKIVPGGDDVLNFDGVSREDFDEDECLDKDAYTLSVEPTAISFGSLKSSQSVNVTSNGSWNVSTSASWISTSKSSGSGNSSFTVNVSNNTDAQRSGSVTVKLANSDKQISITILQEKMSEITRDDYDDDEMLDQLNTTIVRNDFSGDSNLDK